MSTPSDEPVIQGGPRNEGVGADEEWIRSFVRTQPGKTYRIDATDDAHEEAAREALVAAARRLTDEVVRGSEVPVADHTPAPRRPA